MLFSSLINDSCLEEYHISSLECSSYIGARIRAETINENGVGEIYVGFNTGGTAALLSLPESSQGMKW